MTNNANIKCCLNPNNLPEDILTFSDDKFYNYVKNLLGEATAGGLNAQCINNVPSFLLSENICELIELGSNSEELEEIRKKTTFAYRDGSYRVKIVEEENKKIRNLQKTVKTTDSVLSISEEEENNPTSQQLTTTMNTTLSLIEITPDPSSQPLITIINSTSPFVETETNLSLQPLTTTETSQMFDQLPISTSVTSSEPINKINLRTPALLSKDDHAEFLLNLVNKWSQANKDLYFGQIELLPDIDYKINIAHDNNVLQGIIICNCGTRAFTQSIMLYGERKEKKYNEQNQSADNSNDNDCINNMDNDGDNTDNDVDNINDGQQMASQQPLLEINTNVLSSQPSQADVTLLSTTKNAKRNSSYLTATSSQQSSSKRHRI
ncbi:unnamed protein product [Adineta steineri]|uniref:Uncharacterized protein n=1 Tax=Adineta steineri TaxID=433720 RepID=A0A819Q332_9BILA|nr:unnamed protein product [Adineta steineri]CAF4022273.1 unnamed protein product [Adineta steineri]